MSWDELFGAPFVERLMISLQEEKEPGLFAGFTSHIGHIGSVSDILIERIITAAEDLWALQLVDNDISVTPTLTSEIMRRVGIEDNNSPVARKLVDKLERCRDGRLRPNEQKLKSIFARIKARQALENDEPKNQFKKGPRIWSIRWDGGETKPFIDSLGLRYYKILIDNPYVTYSAHDLRKLADRMPDVPKPGMALDVADSEALRTYQREREDLQFKLDEAVKNNDAGASDLRIRIEELSRHIQKAYNLHERVRKKKSELERARKSVSAAMDAARKKIFDEGLTDLAAYLDKFIPTGTCLKYHPTHKIDWDT